jgi:predicted RNA binding protein YcfA (HicA-like mRNA interferase family)
LAGCNSRRLPRVTGKQMIRAFLRAGWVHVSDNGDHWVLKHPLRPGRRTEIQHHARDLHTGIIKRISRTSGLSAEELRALL